MLSFCISNIDNFCFLCAVLFPSLSPLQIFKTSVTIFLTTYNKKQLYWATDSSPSFSSQKFINFIRLFKQLQINICFSYLYYFLSCAFFVFDLPFFSHLLIWTLDHSLISVSIASKVTNFHFLDVAPKFYAMFPLFHKIYFLISILFDLQGFYIYYV